MNTLLSLTWLSGGFDQLLHLTGGAHPLLVLGRDTEVVLLSGDQVLHIQYCHCALGGASLDP